MHSVSEPLEATSALDDACPIMGVLAWENELEQLPGNLIHPQTFPFDVHVERVPGARYETVVAHPTEAMAQAFAQAAVRAEKRGVRFLISTTGLSVVFQRAVTEAVRIPVLTSSLLMLPMWQRMLSPRTKIGVITAGVPYLTPEHYRAAGLSSADFHVVGINRSAVFNKLAVDPAHLGAVDALRDLGVSVARQMLLDEPDLGLILIEVTGLCAVAADIRLATGLPVLDIVECAFLMHNIHFQSRWQRQHGV